MNIKTTILKLTERIRDLWHEREYLWRYHLGWMPVQPCMNCGRWFWGGLPRWWWMGEDGKWGMTWQASWCDFCSRECADEDLAALKEYQIAEYGSERMRIEIDLGNGDVCATSVSRDITAEQLQDIKRLAIIGAEGYKKESRQE